MNEKTRVKSYIRKGKIVRSFDRKGKKKKKLILGSLGALGAIGLAGIGGLVLKKNLGSNIIKSTTSAVTKGTPTAIPIANVKNKLASSVPVRSTILPSSPTQVPVLTSNVPVVSAKEAIRATQPTNLPKVITRPKTSSTSKKKPVLGSNKPVNEPKVISNTQKGSTTYQSSDEIENRISERISEKYKFPSDNNPHNLSKAERYSVAEYTNVNYDEINGTLRGIRKNKELQQNLQDEVNAIRSGLNKMPSTDSPVVYRSVKPSSSIKYKQQKELDDIYDSYEVGKDFTEPAFLSTSTEPLEGFGGNLRYEIIPKKGSQGKNISDYSFVPGEGEVLFPPNTSFKVVDKFIKDNTKWIRIEEL